MGYEDFCKTDIAQAGLQAVYQVMKEAHAYYPTSPWRQMTPQIHINKAFIKAMKSHEDIVSRDEGGTAGGTPGLGLFNWQLALARLFMAASQLPLPKLAAPSTKGEVLKAVLPESVEE